MASREEELLKQVEALKLREKEARQSEKEAKLREKEAKLREKEAKLREKEARRSEKEAKRSEKEARRSAKEANEANEALQLELQKKEAVFTITKIKLDTPSSLSDVCTAGTLITIRTKLAKNRISWGRRAQHNQHIPVELLVPDFGKFQDACCNHDSIEPKGKFYRLLTKFVLVMNAFHKSEESRSTTVLAPFAQIMGKKINIEKNADSNNKVLPDWRNSTNSGKPSFLVEMKNELGTTKNNPFIQVMSYYAHANNHNSKFALNPCILLTICGTHMEFGGACSLLVPKQHGEGSDYECVHMIDALIPPICLSLPFHSLVDRLSRVMLALKSTIIALQNNNQTRSMPYALPTDCKQDFTRIGNKLVWRNDKKVWKFTKKYSTEAHECAHKLGIAPQIHSVQELPGDWRVVEMDWFEGNTLDVCEEENIQFDVEHKNRFVNAVAQFHTNGFVHGDLRNPQNLLYSPDHGFTIIDFDWAGQVGKARYPANMNHVEITWPKGAEPSHHITVKHDNYWLTKLGLN